VAVLAAVPQLWSYGANVLHDDYPGSAYEPRIQALLKVSAAAFHHAPPLTVRTPEGFVPVDRRVNDLGYAALLDAGTRLTGRVATRRTLGLLNLCALAAAAAAMIGLTPRRLRLAVAAVLLLVPFSVAAYRSPDPLAVHGALAALAAASASVISLGPWAGVAVGALLFVVHKIRSAYALYGLAAVIAVGALQGLLWRERKAVLRLILVAATLAALEVPWHLLLRARARDPRVVAMDTLGTHPIYVPLLEGVGWSENPWGIKPWDPWIATYMAEKTGGAPIDVGSRESERRARLVYLDLWRQSPSSLAMIYLRRLPSALREQFVLGLAGAALWLVAMPAAAVVALRRRQPVGLVLAGQAAVVACLLFQTVVIDPRLMYAYPLTVASALSLASALVALAWRADARPQEVAAGGGAQVRPNAGGIPSGGPPGLSGPNR